MNENKGGTAVATDGLGTNYLDADIPSNSEDTGEVDATAVIGDQTDSIGMPPDHLFNDPTGDTGTLPSRVERLETTQAGLQQSVATLHNRQQQLDEQVQRAEVNINQLLGIIDGLSPQEPQSRDVEQLKTEVDQLRSEFESMEQQPTQTQPISALSERIFRTVTGTGAVLTLITAIVWGVLAPSPLILALIMPAAFFIYSYRRGSNVVNE